jgi:hypothetical protein
MLAAMSSDQRSLLFREVNDRIYELLESTSPDLSGEFLCECGRDCGRRVELLPAAYAAVRESGGVVRSSDCRTLRSRQPQAAGGVPVPS